jgi:hypothetical protein
MKPLANYTITAEQNTFKFWEFILTNDIQVIRSTNNAHIAQEWVNLGAKTTKQVLQVVQSNCRVMP